MKNGKLLTLGIETSCDETAASVVADGRLVKERFAETGGAVEQSQPPALAGVDELEEAGEGVSAGGAADVDCDQYPPKRLVTEKVSHADSIAEKAMFRVAQSDNGFLGLLITRWLASGASI